MNAAPASVQSLPFVTGDLPGIGGIIKVQPQHFVVEEIPLYEPQGQGPHLYVRLTREGWTTRDLQKQLAVIFGLQPDQIGCAGLKDKQARVTQTFSLPLPPAEDQRAAQRIQEALGCRVEWMRRHRNKLKTGHLVGNRFRVVVSQPEPEALARAENIYRALEHKGLPNYYGSQRFGIQGENVRRGRAALEGRGPRQKWLRKFLLSAYQAFLFNDWLAERILWGWYERLLPGDIAKKVDTGGLFQVEDAAGELPRFQQGLITYTGPIYGMRMRWPQGEAGRLELHILERAGVTMEVLERARLRGSRRPGRLFLKEFRLERSGPDLVLYFTLPKGAYATTVLREFMKKEPSLSEE